MFDKLEVKTPIDLLHFEPIASYGATKRQTICIVIGVLLWLVVYLPLLLLAHIPSENLAWVLFIALAPVILMGWVKPYGLKFETFLKVYIDYLYNTPLRSGVNERMDTTYVPKRRKDSELVRKYIHSNRKNRRMWRRALRKSARDTVKALRAENKAYRKEARRAAQLARREEKRLKKQKKCSST